MGSCTKNFATVAKSGRVVLFLVTKNHGQKFCSSRGFRSLYYRSSSFLTPFLPNWKQQRSTVDLSWNIHPKPSFFSSPSHPSTFPKHFNVTLLHCQQLRVVAIPRLPTVCTFPTTSTTTKREAKKELLDCYCHYCYSPIVRKLGELWDSILEMCSIL